MTNLRLSTTRASDDGYNGRMPTRSVRLTSPERVLFPDDGITKADVFEYYRAIAPVLVPHLRNRPFTLKRYPYGATGDGAGRGAARESAMQSFGSSSTSSKLSVACPR